MKIIVLLWSSCLFSSKSWDDVTNQSHRLIEWKHRLSAGHEFSKAKRMKTFHAKKVLRKERKSLSVKGKKLINWLKSILTGKCGDSWVESVITKEKGFTKSVQVGQTSWMTSCACNWRSDSMQCLMITFQSFANGIKVSNRNTASEIYSEFIYLCWGLWSPCFSPCFAKVKLA